MVSAITTSAKLVELSVGDNVSDAPTAETNVNTSHPRSSSECSFG